MPRRYTGGFLSSKEQVTDANSASGVFSTQEAGALTAAGSFPTGRWNPQRSLRFRGLNSSYLSRTPTVTGNRKVWTWSAWVKRGQLNSAAADLVLMSCTAQSGNDGIAAIYFNADQLHTYYDTSGANPYGPIGPRLYRDPAAWYHIVWAVDAANTRHNVYVNGVLVSTDTTKYPPNYDYAMNRAGYLHTMGTQAWGPTNYFDGYMAEVNFVDGQFLDPSQFGTTDPQTGVWIPKRYTGTYGTNGFYLPFNDTSAIGTVLSNTATVTAPFGGTATNARSSDSNYVVSNTSTGSSFELVKYDLGAITQITAISVSGWSFTNNASSTGVIEFSDDDITYSVLVSATLSSASYYNNSWSIPVSTRYIRIRHTQFGTNGQGVVDSLVIYTNSPVWDKSGKANPNPWDFQAGQFSNSALTTYDLMTDVPGIQSVTSQLDNGGVQRGNYCVINPISLGSNLATYQANCSVYNTSSTDTHRTARATMGMTTGKWYWEVHVNNSANVDILGLADDTLSPNNYVGGGGRSAGWGYSTSTGGWYYQTGWSANSSAPPAFPSSGIIGVAFDADTGKLWFSSNGSWLSTNNGIGVPATGANPNLVYSGDPTTFYPAVSIYYNGGGWVFNFGQRPFFYNPPTGFKTLNTTNLPTPVIKRPSEHFDVKTWTGTGTSLQVGTTSKETSAFSTSSLEFKSEQISYLTRTPAVTGSQTTATYSFWLKRAVISANHPFHTTKIATAGTNATVLQLRDNNKLDITFASTGGTNYGNQTNRLFTDTTSWYHVVAAVDTTQANASNRLKVYVNGVQVTLWDTSSVPPQNATLVLSNSSLPLNIGADPRDATYFNGSISEAYFIDGQALTPSSFGIFDANNNWMPQRYTGTYGTNGFYLPLSKPTDTPVMSFGATFTGGAGSSTQLVTSTNTNLALGTNNFTVEYWYTRTNPASGGETALTFGTGQDTYAPLFGYTNTDGSLMTYMSSNGSAWDIVSGNIVARPTVAGQWNHIAITRSGNTFTAYHNGKQTTTWTSSASIFQNANSVSIGKGQGGNGAGNNAWQGMISNVRVVIGSVLYTSNFTPSTTPFTAVANTRLLTLQDSTIIDNSTNALTFTNTGSVAVSDASPWQRTVGYDASGSNNNFDLVNFDYSVPRSNVLIYGTPGTYTWVAPAGVTSVKALVIAGGGAGGSNGGGGGAGGMIYNAAVSVTPGTSYTVTVGRGGHTRNQGNATNSVFSSLTAVAGGNGATYAVSAAQNGGSGGGGTLGNNTPGTGTAGQGNAGGAGNNGNSGNTYYHGGGGGAGSAGTAGGSGGAGGAGLVNSITGIPIYYAGGGGGHYFSTNTPVYAAGGIGGGGTGQSGRNGPAAGGRPNSGGGGGGTSAGLGGGPGGSGVVILSYTNAASYVGDGANSIVASDISRDTPTDFEDTTGVSGNYPILNYPNYTISNSNSGNTWNITNAGLTLMSDSSGAHKIVPATMPISSGKWYFEMILESNASDAYSAMGLIPWPLPNHDYLTNLPSSSSTTNGFSWQSGTTNSFTFWTDYIGGASTYVTVNPISAAAIGDVMQIAIDIDNNKIWVGRNNVWYNSSGGNTGNPSTGANPTATNVLKYIGQYGALVPFCSVGQENMITANFGQTWFMYTPPTGFKAINSKNLKDVGSTNLPDTFGNFVNSPDLVWTKSRTQATSLYVYDSVRGAGNRMVANSNVGTAAISGVTSFIPNGFTLGTETGNNNVGDRYVGYSWNRGRTPGFDIVNYGGDGVNGRMIPHNLGVTPAFYITKCLTSYNNSQSFTDWSVYHKDCPTYTGNSRQGKQTLWLHRELAAANGVGGFFNTATPTEFSPNQINYDNSLGQSYIAYLWAEVPGFSKFGSWAGNSDTNGPFIYTGFRPRWIMTKRYTSTGNWLLLDTLRNQSNDTTATLAANLTDAEGTGAGGNWGFDILSNGFKIRGLNSEINTSGQSYIYAAFAESPFKYANAR